MHKQLLAIGAIAALATVAIGSPAKAANIPITDLFSTGALTQTTAAPTLGQADLHYTIAQTTANAFTANPIGDFNSDPDAFYSTYVAPLGPSDFKTTFVTNGAFFPVSGGNWPSQTASPTTPPSQWISPKSTYNGFQSDLPGFYVFRTTFTLTEIPISASINGSWGTDNAGLGIFLNGVYNQVQYTQTDNFFSIKIFAPSNVQSQFIQGLNTLDVVLLNKAKHPTPAEENAGNPVGLRMSVAGSYTAVPEPIFLQLGVLLAGGGLAGLRSRMRRSA